MSFLKLAFDVSFLTISQPILALWRVWLQMSGNLYEQAAIAGDVL